MLAQCFSNPSHRVLPFSVVHDKTQRNSHKKLSDAEVRLTVNCVYGDGVATNQTINLIKQNNQFKKSY